MRPKEFLNHLDDRRIVEAIRKAERVSSGEIRVYISHKQVQDVISEAKVHFLRLGMQKTKRRNAVLIYIAPRSRNFAIIGDVGVHSQCGDNFWRDTATVMESHLKQNRFTDAVVAAVEEVGSVLAAHFPRQPDDRNELPDDVIQE
jgi:uncharacterized membrane protein